MSDAQSEFDELVRTFNRNYLDLLRKAAEGETRWLVENFVCLKDLYDAVITTHDTAQLEFRVAAYPLTILGNDLLLRELGFTAADIERIGLFLEHYRRVTGTAFELVREK